MIFGIIIFKLFNYIIYKNSKILENFKKNKKFPYKIIKFILK